MKKTMGCCVLCVVIWLWAGSLAGAAAAQEARSASDSGRMLFPAALLEASERSGLPVLAEVGTWMGRWSVKASHVESDAESSAKTFQALGAPTRCKVREQDGWILARSEEWYWLPRRDCDGTVLLQIFRDGGITPATVPGVAAMSRLQRLTLREWLGRRTASRPEPPCPELLDLDDDHTIPALGLWAALAPRQLDTASRVGLRADQLLPPQTAILNDLLLATTGVMLLPESAPDVVLRIGPRAMTAWSKYHPETPQPPGREKGATAALTVAGWPREEAVEVPLPIVHSTTMEARRKQATTSKSFLATEFGAIRSLWPRHEDRTGLATLFDLRCAIVKVKDVLLHITRACGVHLKADDWAGQRYLVADFKQRTVDDFRRALAELLDCKWRYDEEGEYWLLYQDEEARKEEARLIAEKEAQEREKLEERIADNPMSGVVEDLLDQLDPDTAERIRAGLPVDVPLDEVPRGLWAAIGQCALFDTSGAQAVSVTGWEPLVDDLTTGWLEFRPAGSANDVVVYGVLTFENSAATAVGPGCLRIRRNLGPVLPL